jgi:chorismate-pyruvate lyase
MLAFRHSADESGPVQAIPVLRRSKAWHGAAMRNSLRLLTALLLTTGGAVAQTTREARLDRLKSDILASASATQLLTARCGELKLATPAVVRAQTVPVAQGADADVRALLKVDAAEPVRHRHVRLTCGGHVLSEADNWYVPSRLTAEMNQTLDGSDTPFGTVVRPLNFHRDTVAATPQTGATVLQVKAVLLTPLQSPISLVIENYSGELLDDAN